MYLYFTDCCLFVPDVCQPGTQTTLSESAELVGALQVENQLFQARKEHLQAQVSRADDELQRLQRQQRNMEAELQANASKLQAYKDMITILEDDVVITDLKFGQGGYGG